MRYLQFENPFAGDFFRHPPPDLHSFGGGENPFLIDRIQLNVKVLPAVALTDVMIAIVDRHLTFAIHATRKGVFRQMVQNQFHIPVAFLPGLTIVPIHMLQSGKRLPTAPTFDTRILLTLDAVHLIQPLLQLVRVTTSLGLAPAFARTLRPFDHPVVLGAPRRIPAHPHIKADQPQRQVGGPIAFRSPRSAIVDPKALGASPPRKNLTQRILHSGGVNLVPVSLGGKSWSANLGQCIHPRGGASWPLGRQPRASAPPRPSAKPHEAGAPDSRRWSDAGPQAQAAAWFVETNVATFARWVTPPVPPVTTRELSRRPRWDAAVASARPS